MLPDVVEPPAFLPVLCSAPPAQALFSYPLLAAAAAAASDGFLSLSPPPLGPLFLLARGSLRYYTPLTGVPLSIDLSPCGCRDDRSFTLSGSGGAVAALVLIFTLGSWICIFCFLIVLCGVYNGCCRACPAPFTTPVRLLQAGWGCQLLSLYLVNLVKYSHC